MTESTPAPDEATATDAAPENDVKAKFREALARKNAKHHASAAAGETGDSKVQSAHGPASQTKQFRRKAGG
jgi:hypothetical protein